jgi:hypothetical protein
MKPPSPSHDESPPDQHSVIRLNITQRLIRTDSYSRFEPSDNSPKYGFVSLRQPISGGPAD